nr:hypothetical protein [Tanacetum cinerariifolium]
MTGNKSLFSTYKAYDGGGNNAEASSSASGQAQQTELAFGQDTSGGSGVVIGLSAAAGEGGAGVASQGSSRSR